MFQFVLLKFGLSTPGLSTQVFSVLPALSMCPGGIGSWFQAYVLQLSSTAQGQSSRSEAARKIGGSAGCIGSSWSQDMNSFPGRQAGFRL